MENTYKLTDKQKAYLDSLVCQRISKDEANKDVIEAFINYTNPRLPYALYNGWYQDKRDELAYYIIKDPSDQEPLLFFSLKCGILHIPFIYQAVVEACKEAEALYNAARNRRAPEWARAEINRRRVNGIVPPEVLRELGEDYAEKKEKMLSFQEEMRKGAPKIIQVERTHPGVEMVHFCAHEPAQDKWEEMGMAQQSMGKTLFWYFIVPKLNAIRELVGCEYIYLFAADSSRKKSLVNYYTKLGFEVRLDIGVEKPAYDFGCTFMCQKLTSLRNQRIDFFNNYNKPKPKEN